MNAFWGKKKWGRSTFKLEHNRSTSLYFMFVFPLFYQIHSILYISLGPRRLYLALASIQCFIIDSIAPESPDSKSAGCKAVTFGEIELLTF